MLADYLDVITGRGRGEGWIELRYREGAGMRSRFYPARGEHVALLALISRLGGRTDVYLGCAPRRFQRGDRSAVGSAWAVWVDCDGPDARGALRAFRPEPTLVIASGSDENVHAYWALGESIDPDTVDDANRRLAETLGADSSCCHAAAILRPPGTHNHKHVPPRQVRQLGPARPQPHALSDVIDGLDPQPRAGKAPALRREEAADPLLAIPPAVYVSALTGKTVGRDRKIQCPFHALSVGEAAADGVSPARSVNDASSNDRRVLSDPLLLVPPPVYFERLTGRRVGRSGKLHCLFHDDREPSLHVYREPDRGWFCFGCRRGGSVYDLAALLFGLKTRGADFIELRRELEQRLL